MIFIHTYRVLGWHDETNASASTSRRDLHHQSGSPRAIYTSSFPRSLFRFIKATTTNARYPMDKQDIAIFSLPTPHREAPAFVKLPEYHVQRVQRLVEDARKQFQVSIDIALPAFETSRFSVVISGHVTAVAASRQWLLENYPAQVNTIFPRVPDY